jgi:hypothetical protein
MEHSTVAVDLSQVQWFIERLMASSFICQTQKTIINYTSACKNIEQYSNIHVYTSINISVSAFFKMILDLLLTPAFKWKNKHK